MAERVGVDVARGRVRTLSSHCSYFLIHYLGRLPAPRGGGGGDPGDLRRKEDTVAVAVVTLKWQLKIPERVY